MNAEIVRITENGESLIEDACRCCYQSYHRKNPPESTAKLIQHVLKEGHFSVLEHATVTFKITGVSRALTHELVRHRLFSFSQESQRYVNYCDLPATNQPGQKGKSRKKTKDFSYFTPLDIAESEDLSFQEKWDTETPINNSERGWITIPPPIYNYHRIVDLCYKYYEFLLSKGIKPEDARYILPNATCSDIYVTGNVRTWRHFIQLRCHPRAMEEIRLLATQIKNTLINRLPNCFFDYKLGALTEEDYKEIVIT